jgi:hypothetical protein
MKQLLKWLSILMIVILGTCCMVKAPKAPGMTETTAERLQSVTVALIMSKEVDDGIRVAAGCSGVWVSRTEFVTAAHCVEPEVQALTKLFGLEIKVDALGTQHKFLVPSDIKDQDDEDDTVVTPDTIRYAEVVAYDEGIDLALLKVGPESLPTWHPVATVGRGKLRVGDSVHVVGHTNGFWWSYSRGEIAAERELSGPFDAPIHVLQISAPIWNGNSGGGVFDETGQLIGLSSFMVTRVPSLAFFVHRNVLLMFLIDNGVAEI